MKKQKIIIRTDLLSKSDFSRRYEISRSKLDELIRDNMLQIEVISGVSYINISDKTILDNALQYKTVRQGAFPRSPGFKMPVIKGSEQDMEFERAWRKSMGIK